MAQTKLKIAQAEIERFFNRRKAQIIRRRELDSILSKKGSDWDLKSSTTAREFITFLLNQRILTKYEMKFPYRKEVRYAVGKKSIYQIIQSLRSKSYFSHATALSLHGLTEAKSKTIYLNHEQPKKGQYTGQLTQEGIDSAFQNHCRVTRNIATLRGRKVCLLNGKYTGQLGVTSIEDETGNIIRVSDVERTLIDSTVRPVYSGSIRSVIKCYTTAADLISIERLFELLVSLDYVYPYHQAIGFCLERSGAYGEDLIELFESLEKKFDFYLTYQMKNPKYSTRWKLYYPRSL